MDDDLKSTLNDMGILSAQVSNEMKKFLDAQTHAIKLIAKAQDSGSHSSPQHRLRVGAADNKKFSVELRDYPDKSAVSVRADDGRTFIACTLDRDGVCHLVGWLQIWLNS